MTFAQSISTSWELMKNCFRFLRTNKDLLFFPAISFVAILIFLMLTGTITFLHLPLLKKLTQENAWLILIPIAIVYFCLSFIAVYFNASFIACVTLRLRGEKSSLFYGLKYAAKHWLQLVKWALISSTIGLIIKALERSHSLVEEIIGGIIGLTWGLCAYFVIPILIFQNIGPFAALKKSATVFGRNWRRIVSVNLIFFLLFLAGIAIIYGLSFITHVIPILLVFLVFGILFLITVTPAFGAIITGALYLNHVEHIEPKGFDKSLLDRALIKKKKLLRR